MQSERIRCHGIDAYKPEALAARRRQAHSSMCHDWASRHGQTACTFPFCRPCCRFPFTKPLCNNCTAIGLLNAMLHSMKHSLWQQMRGPKCWGMDSAIAQAWFIIMIMSWTRLTQARPRGRQSWQHLLQIYKLTLTHIGTAIHLRSEGWRAAAVHASWNILAHPAWRSKPGISRKARIYSLIQQLIAAQQPHPTD